MQRNEEAIFEAALQYQDPAERRRYAVEACGTDAKLRSDVEALLKAHDSPSLLDEPVVEYGLVYDASEVVEGPGTVIGRYKLLERIGEGGMAVVYMAEQEQPIRRKVALKIIKLGMDTRQVIARFEAERQALALMDHPNIAKVFDAGATETGRPYFVMELVQGVSITEYCDHNSLTTRERLGLFLQVCHAVQHAHQKGIIHRDIKPSNILVTHHDGQPIPEVIDFGIAKATNQRLTEKTLFTRYAHIIGTPAYMSPEQAELNDLDIDTRTDIYSLGVLLYELLTGTTPFGEEELRKAGYVEMQRVIREQEPIKPSTKLTTLGKTLADVARHRQCTPELLRKAIRGDLDWIVMKSLEKDRSRRYETTTGLAADIRRHVEHRPVTACPPSTLYRFQKLVRRNRGTFGAVAVVVAVLVFGVVVSTWQGTLARRAERAQIRLRQEAQANELAMRQTVYAADMSVAQQALARDDLGRALRLLEAHRPGPGEADLRGWEWRYLWQGCRTDAVGQLCRDSNGAFSVAYSPNGRVLAVAGCWPGGFVEIWDVPSRTRIATLQTNEGHLVAFSPQGDLLATDAGENHIRLWRTSTADLVAQLSLRGKVRVLKFSPDGTQLACLSDPDELTVWEVTQWAVVRRIRGVRLVGAHIGALDFSPDSKALVVGDADHQLQVIDLASGRTNFNIAEAHSEGITSVAWSPNGSVIASGGGYSGGPIGLWDSASGKTLGAMEGHTSWTSGLIFSADGLQLYSAGADQTIRIWDVGQRRCLATLRGSTEELTGLTLSPDGTTLASAAKDGVVAFWNARPPPEERLPSPIASYGPPAFAPASRVMAVPRAGIVSLFDLATLREIEQLPALGTDGVCVVTYSPDGALLASGSKTGKIRVWSCTKRRLLSELDGHNNQICLLHLRTGGTRLLSMDARGKATAWDVLTGQAARTFAVETFSGRVAVSPDGRLLTVGDVGAWRWLNAETGEVLGRTTGGHRLLVGGVAFSRDGARVASVAEDGTVGIWDLPSFNLIAAFKGHMRAAHGVAFSPDGRRLATGGSDGEAVKLWDLSTYRELMTLSARGSVFSFVGFSPDGRWLTARSREEGNLWLWYAPSWGQIEAAEKSPESGQSLRGGKEPMVRETD